MSILFGRKFDLRKCISYAEIPLWSPPTGEYVCLSFQGKPYPSVPQDLRMHEFCDLRAKLLLTDVPIHGKICLGIGSCSRPAPLVRVRGRTWFRMNPAYIGLEYRQDVPKTPALLPAV